VKGKLLRAFASVRVPYDGRLVHAGTQYICASLVPLQSKYRTLVLAQRTHQPTCNNQLEEIPARNCVLYCTKLWLPSALFRYLHLNSPSVPQMRA
jgi:hypothetical protein